MLWLWAWLAEPRDSGSRASVPKVFGTRALGSRTFVAKACGPHLGAQGLRDHSLGAQILGIQMAWGSGALRDRALVVPGP